MHGSSPTTAPTLTEAEREALFREYDVWLKLTYGSGGSKKCHLPDPDVNDSETRPLCDRPLPSGRWVSKNPECFPSAWADLCADCGEIAVSSEERKAGSE